MIAVKFYKPSSSYKKELAALQPGKEIIASQLSGDFVMPKNLKIPIAFIAGGVGITPFRSIIEDIIEKQVKVDIILIFANKTKGDIIFNDTLEKARPYGVKTVYVLTDKESVPEGWTGVVGHLNESTIKEVVPDYDKRLFYISGPQLMVQSFEKILRSTGVRKKFIKLDFFPGYAES